MKSLLIILKNRTLLFSLAKRDILIKYKGSAMGTAWSVLMPLFMLIIYTFVFSSIFKAKWSGQSSDGPKTEFALILFIGIMAYNFIADCITRSPTILHSNVNYIKKIVFPIEILPCIHILSGLFNTFVTFIIWLLCYIIINGIPHITVLYVPIILLPMILLCLGISYLFSSLGVFFKDLNQITGLLVTALMFLSPIFYPASAIPEKYRILMNINPLTPAVESLRNTMYWGVGPDMQLLGISYIISIIFFLLGFGFFQKTKKGFSDVL